MLKNNNSLGIIPARYASTRFPGKPLADIAGKPMIQRVYERAASSNLDKVVVATDDLRIADAVMSFGGEALITSTAHPSGTDRCAEVAALNGFEEYAFVVNIQGDEPGIDSALINAALELLRSDEQMQIATLAAEMDEAVQLADSNVVKVVFDQRQKALYFSRSQIPYVRGGGTACFYRHIGLYAFRRKALLQVARLPQGILEKAEQLEQLRWLEHGYPIGVAVVTHNAVSIDTPADLAAFLKQYR